LEIGIGAIAERSGKNSRFSIRHDGALNSEQAGGKTPKRYIFTLMKNPRSTHPGGLHSSIPVLIPAISLLLASWVCQGSVLVDLDASQLPTGPLPTWQNHGTATGNFTSAGTAVPEVVTKDDAKGIAFLGGTAGADGTHYVGPAAPDSVTAGGSRTIEAWVYNSSAQGEETVFAWGRRGGGDGSNCSFGHGTDATFGAVGHWGVPDIGWNGKIEFNKWTYIAYTYDGDTTTVNVYMDGEVANTVALANPLDTWAVDSTAEAKPLAFRVARQSEDTGLPSGVGVGEIIISKIRVHDTALSADTIKAKWNSEKIEFKIGDSDNDGMPDWFEVRYSFLNVNDPTDAAKDQDLDGLTNLEEYQKGTTLDKPDTDGDGINDGAEVKRTVNGQPAATDPLKADTDGDGLSDGVETNTGVFVNAQNTGTNPLQADTDGDGFTDFAEVLYGSNPASATSKPVLGGTLVVLNATQLPEGPLASWSNGGNLGGSFVARDPSSPPRVTSINRVKGVTMNGTEYYTGPAAPVWITGNGAHTIEAWVYNPELADEETIFSWGRRGGGDGSNCSFNHGQNASYGAVGHWGAPDIGWDGNIVAAQWTHVAYTWDSETYTTTVYKDGEAVVAETLDVPLVIWATDDTPSAGPLPFRVASQNDSNGGATADLRGSMTIAKIVVFDKALDSDTIRNHYTQDKTAFGLVDTDADGMPDWFEAMYPFLNPSDPSDAAKDQDQDGLTNLDEFKANLPPDNPDADNDGLTDGDEVNRTHTNPKVADTDQDGLRDGVETKTGTYVSAENTGTDPLVADTDGDTFADGLEVIHSANPVNAASKPTLTPGAKIIDLDATVLTAGPLAAWTNQGALKGTFKASSTVADVTMVSGVAGVTLNGVDQYYTGPVTPTWMTGNNPHTIEAWIYNPVSQDEETIFAWGRRGGPDGSNCSFNHGQNADYGAVGHWGGADIGWNGKVAVSQWTHVAYTWDPTAQTESVYQDGQLANSKTVDTGLAIWAVDSNPDPNALPLPFRVGTQSDANGAATTGLRGSMTIARIQVYDQALTAQAIAAQYQAEAPLFSSVAKPKLEGVAFSAANDTFSFTWTTVPGVKYTVESSANLTAWDIAAQDLTVGTFTVKPSAVGPIRYYRVRVQ
jgi:hypothetical protein